MQEQNRATKIRSCLLCTFLTYRTDKTNPFYKKSSAETPLQEQSLHYENCTREGSDITLGKQQRERQYDSTAV